MLTFPADKSDFPAPNGVTYAWDGVDEKWRVKAFRSIDDFIVQLEDNPPPDSESKKVISGSTPAQTPSPSSSTPAPFGSRPPHRSASTASMPPSKLLSSSKTTCWIVLQQAKPPKRIKHTN